MECTRRGRSVVVQRFHSLYRTKHSILFGFSWNERDKDRISILRLVLHYICYVVNIKVFIERSIVSCFIHKISAPTVNEYQMSSISTFCINNVFYSILRIRSFINRVCINKNIKVNFNKRFCHFEVVPILFGPPPDLSLHWSDQITITKHKTIILDEMLYEYLLTRVLLLCDRCTGLWVYYLVGSIHELHPARRFWFSLESWVYFLVCPTYLICIYVQSPSDI